MPKRFALFLVLLPFFCFSQVIINPGEQVIIKAGSCPTVICPPLTPVYIHDTIWICPTIPPVVIPPSTGTRQNIIYEDGFERNDPGKMYANEQQWCCSYSVTSATDIVREGTRSVRMEHRGTDPVVSSGERVELKSTANFKSLPEVWYGYSIYFKEPWPSFAANEHLPQWHPQSNSGGMVLGMWTGKGTFDLKTNPSGGSSSNSLVSNPKKIVTNKWTDFVWHIKWGSPGLLEVWIDGELYYSKAITTSTSGIPYFKFGLNGGSYPANLNRIFYMDALRIGNNFATYKDVAP